jgi:CheY-like chemotaxis protein
MRILIIDDESSFAELVAMNLEESGDIEVQCACDSRHSIAVAAEWRPDLILLDMVMPGMSGEEVFRQLQERAELRAIPIIFMSASANDNSIVQGPHVEHLPKPMSVKALLEAIHRHVGTGACTGIDLPATTITTEAVVFGMVAAG